MNLREGRIGQQEAICAVTLAVSCKLIFVPQTLFVGTGNTAWYSTLLTAVWAVILFVMALALMHRTGAPGLLEALDCSLGKSLGTVCRAAWIGALFVGAGAVVGECVGMLSQYVMPSSPLWFLILLILCGAFPAAWMGFEAIGRLSKIFMVMFVAGAVLLFAGTLQHFESYRLYPLLGEGIGRTAGDSLTRLTLVGDVFFMATLSRTMQRKRFIARSGMAALGFSGGIAALVMLCMALVFSAPMLEKITVPLFKTAAMTSFGGEFSRMEGIFVFVWIMCVALATAFSLYGCSNLYCKTFGMRDIRAALAAFGVLMFLWCSFAAENSPVYRTIIAAVEQYGYLLVVAPVVLGFLASLLQKRGKYEQQA